MAIRLYIVEEKPRELPRHYILVGQGSAKEIIRKLGKMVELREVNVVRSTETEVQNKVLNCGEGSVG